MQKGQSYSFGNIDDSKANRIILEEVFESRGHKYHGVGLRYEFEAMLRAHPGLDLILLDVELAVGRGDSLVKFSRDHAKSAGVYFFSAQDEFVLKALVRSSGADGYVQKSLLNMDKDIFVDHLVRLIEAHRKSASLKRDLLA